MNRRNWYARRLGDPEIVGEFSGTVIESSVVFVCDDFDRVSFVGFALPDGSIRGSRLDDNGRIWDITASDVEALLLGLRDAFRADARDTSAEVN